jgi:putative permease
VLAFGGIWGFWGVFFAIPLASLIKAVINAWPTTPAEPA